jgi:hypothetical protein
MSRIIYMLIAVACATLIGCQGTGASQKQLGEVRSELEQMRAYIAELQVYLDSSQAIQDRLFKTCYRSNPREMARMFPRPTIDTLPGPKPPGPPFK